MNAPFRIRYTNGQLERLRNESRESVTSGKVADSRGATRNNYNNYVARLVALVPTEVLGIYMILREAVQAKNATLMVDYQWIFWACLLLVLLSRVFGTLVKEEQSILEKVDWISVAVLFVSFIIWTLNLEGTLPFLDSVDDEPYAVDNILIMGIVIIWTFIVPFFLKPQKLEDVSN